MTATISPPALPVETPQNKLAEHYLNPHEAAEILGIEYQTLSKWRIDGRGPPWLKLNPRVVRYKLSSILAWMESCSSSSAGRQ